MARKIVVDVRTMQKASKTQRQRNRQLARWLKAASRFMLTPYPQTESERRANERIWKGARHV